MDLRKAFSLLWGDQPGDLTSESYRLDGAVIYQFRFTMPHPRTLEPMQGTKIMAAWGMIPRNEG